MQEEDACPMRRRFPHNELVPVSLGTIQDWSMSKHRLWLTYLGTRIRWDCKRSSKQNKR